MAHNHGHHHHHHHNSDEAARNIGLAFWLNLGFAVIELVGGWWTQSFAIMSDALHDLGDAMSLGLGWILQKKSTQGPSETFSYGLKRLSLLSAFISGTILSVGAIFIAIEAASRFGQSHEPHGLGMMALAVLGISVNGFAAWKLSRGQTQNEKVLKWHLIEDLLGWVAVFIGSILIWLFAWNWLDLFLAIAISVFVLYNVIRSLRETISLFLQANPNPSALKSFRAEVENLPEIASVHDVHYWSLDGVHHILSLHAVVIAPEKAAQVKERIREISHKLGKCHVTIEIESSSSHCHDDCENSDSAD